MLFPGVVGCVGHAREVHGSGCHGLGIAVSYGSMVQRQHVLSKVQVLSHSCQG